VYGIRVDWLRRITALLCAIATLVPTAVAGARDETAEEPTDETRVEFERRLGALPRADHEKAVALAEWAIDHRLLEQADGVYRYVLGQDPDNDAAFYGLWDLNRGRPLALESDAYTKAREFLPESFVEYETRHYVLLSDADPEWTAEQGARLERAHDRFRRFSIQLDLRALPLRHKLVAVAFRNRQDFVALARQDENDATDRLAGYYSLPQDRLVLYHVESNRNVASARRQLESMRSEIDAVMRRSRRSHMTGRRREGRETARTADDRIRAHDEQQRRIDDFARQRSLTVTIHEAIHQLVFHMRVQSPYVQNPLWLTEGLATAFETDNARSAFGPGQEFSPRRMGFYDLLDNDRLLPLRELLSIDHRDFAKRPGHVDAVYQQGYALVTWLSRHRRIELRKYIRSLAALPHGAPSRKGQVELFEEAFGDVERLEEQWLREMN